MLHSRRKHQSFIGPSTIAIPEHDMFNKYLQNVSSLNLKNIYHGNFEQHASAEHLWFGNAISCFQSLVCSQGVLWYKRDGGQM